jgi:hypothetical protein
VVNTIVRSLRELLEEELKGVDSTEDTAAWTRAVKTALLRSREAVAAATGIQDPRAMNAFFNGRAGEQQGPGEYMLDFCWAIYPEDFVFGEPLPSEPMRILLAAESEWGKAANARGNYSLVLADFAKVLDVKAAIKVMVYGCHVQREPDAPALRSAMESILRGSAAYRPDEEWLLLGMPWDSEETELHLHTVEASSDGPRLVSLSDGRRS